MLRDPSPDAYALPGRPGRIVVTTGMLRALEPAEREALFAHERAHLVGRHHLFLAAAELAAHCHPALRSLREPLAYALERSADEYAAGAVGDRKLAARAIGRAALASRAVAAPGRPRAVLAAAAGPVPRRVAALLDRRPAAQAAPLARRPPDSGRPARLPVRLGSLGDRGGRGSARRHRDGPGRDRPPLSAPRGDRFEIRGQSVAGRAVPRTPYRRLPAPLTGRAIAPGFV